MIISDAMQHAEDIEIEGAFGQLPNDWDSMRLNDGSLFSYESGLWTGKVGPQMEAQVLRNTNFNNDGTLDYSEVASLQVEARQLPRKQLLPGDILIERSGGGPKQPVGRVVLFDQPSGLYSFSNFTARLRVENSREVDPHFTLYALLFFHQFGGTLRMQENTTGIRNLKFELYKQLSLPRPPIPEQRAIAGILSKVRSAGVTQERIVTSLRELKAATLAKLFHEGVRGEKLQQTEIGEMPRGWELSPLGKRCRIVSGGTPPRDVPSYWDGKIPWVKTGEINYREIKTTAENITEQGLANSSAKIVKKGTVLLAMYGQGVTRGRVAMLGIDAATNQACAALFPDQTVDASFLYAYCMFAYERIRELGHGANQKNLSADILKQMLIPVPPDLDEQREIGAIAKKLGATEVLAEERQAQLVLLFSVTLRALMTGQARAKRRGV